MEELRMRISSYKICITGLPAAGKSTQGKIVAEKLGARYFSLDTQARVIEQDKTETGAALRAYFASKTAQQEPLPDELARGVATASLKNERAWVLEGFPCSIAQTRGVEDIIRLIFYLRIPEKLARQRMLASMHAEETLETVDLRLRSEIVRINSLIPYLRASDRLIVVEIDATKTVSQVSEEITRFTTMLQGT